MTNSTTDSRSTRPHPNASQYGMALFRHSYPGGYFAPGRAAILQPPAKSNRFITRQISISGLLAALGLDTSDSTCDAAGSLSCDEIQLDAGAILYEPGKHGEHAFVILSGVVARQQASESQSGVRCAPSSIALSGAKEMIGLHLGSDLRPENATAVTKAILLALPIKALQALVPSSTLINDLLMRTAGAALLRDWRVSYRLRDLPAFARTVAALSYLANLAEFRPAMTGSDGTIALSMPVTNLATWLALDVTALQTELKRLERYGVVSTFEEAIRWLDPIKLETLWALD